MSDYVLVALHVPPHLIFIINSRGFSDVQFTKREPGHAGLDNSARVTQRKWQGRDWHPDWLALEPGSLTPARQPLTLPAYSEKTEALSFLPRVTEVSIKASVTRHWTPSCACKARQAPKRPQEAPEVKKLPHAHLVLPLPDRSEMWRSSKTKQKASEEE